RCDPDRAWGDTEEDLRVEDRLLGPPGLRLALRPDARSDEPGHRGDRRRQARAALAQCRKTPEEYRRGLIGRPEGRPRPERVLKDAGAPPSFRTDPAAEAGLQPVRSPLPISQRPFSCTHCDRPFAPAPSGAAAA